MLSMSQWFPGFWYGFLCSLAGSEEATGFEQVDGLNPERVQGVGGRKGTDNRRVGLSHLFVGGSKLARGLSELDWRVEVGDS